MNELSETEKDILKAKMFLEMDNDQALDLPYAIFRTSIELNNDKEIKEQLLVEVFKELLQEGDMSITILRKYPIFVGSEVKVLESRTGIALIYKYDTISLSPEEEEIVRTKMFYNLRLIKEKRISSLMCCTHFRSNKKKLNYKIVEEEFKKLLKSWKTSRKLLMKYPVFLGSEVGQDDEDYSICCYYKKKERN